MAWHRSIAVVRSFVQSIGDLIPDVRMQFLFRILLLLLLIYLLLLMFLLLLLFLLLLMFLILLLLLCLTSIDRPSLPPSSFSLTFFSTSTATNKPLPLPPSSFLTLIGNSQTSLASSSLSSSHFASFSFYSFSTYPLPHSSSRPSVTLVCQHVRQAMHETGIKTRGRLEHPAACSSSEIDGAAVLSAGIVIHPPPGIRAAVTPVAIRRLTP